MSDEETELDANALADELNLGIELSPEEEAEAAQMVARLRSQFGLDEETSEPPAEEDEPEAEDTGEEAPAEEESVEPPVPAPPSAPAAVSIDGREIPISEIQSMLQLRQWLEANPDKAQRLTQEPEPEPPSIPDWLDQDDPVQVAMWNRQVELERTVQQIKANQEQIAETQKQTKAQQGVSAGFQVFRTNHPELSEEDIQKVRTHTVAMGLIDPLANQMGVEAGTIKALDIAYKDIPEFQARPEIEAKKAERTERKAKLSALGGTSGSAPRTETKPDLSSDRAAKQAAAEWLRQSGVLGPQS